MRSFRSFRTRSLLAAALFLALLVVGCSLLTVTADESDAETDGDYTYTVNDGKATITKYNGSEGNITIPSTLGGYSVTAIGGFAFKGDSWDANTIPTSVVIPNSVTTIGESAFQYCTNLASVTFEEGSKLTTIEEYAFIGCSSLNMALPDSVITIDYCAFQDCTKLTTGIPKSSTDIGNNSFENTGLTTVTIPGTLKTIDTQVFMGCTSLKTLIIEKGVERISSESFKDCTALTEVTIPDSVNFINTTSFSVTFYDYDGVTNASVLGGFTFKGAGDGKLTKYDPTVQTIGDFKYKLDPENKTATVIGYVGSGGNVEIPATVQYDSKNYNVTAIGDNAFQMDSYTGEITSVIIPDSVTGIGNCAFIGLNEKLKSVTIGNGVTSIGNQAFLYCKVLDTVTFKDGSNLTSIGNAAFEDCIALQKIDVPNFSVPSISIGDCAFQGNDCIETVTIGSGVSSIGKSAFYQCYSLKTVTFKGECTFTSIGEQTFYRCMELTSITIPNTVTSIGKSAFDTCIGLTSITIPNSVTSIESSAFVYCTGLTEVTFGTGITTIGSTAFYGYSVKYGGNGGVQFYEADGTTEIDPATGTNELKGNRFEGTGGKLLKVDPTVQTIGDFKYKLDPENKTATVIGYVGSGGNVEIPATVLYDSKNYNVTAIGDDAFDSCTGITSVTIPGAVTSIGENAFSYCDELTQITIPESVTKIESHAFCSCKKLTTVKIPELITSIEEGVFSSCNKLTGITIPKCVTTIGKGAFDGCIGLTSITIPESVTTIAFGAFYGCTGLTEVTFGNGITTIEDQAFGQLNGTVWEGVQFYADSGYTLELTTASELKGNTFVGTGGKLVNSDPTVLYAGGIKYKLSEGSTNTATATGYYASGLPTNGVLTIPATVEKNSKTYSVTAIGAEAFKDCTALISLTILDSVTTIGENALSGCTGLTSVTFGKGLTSCADCGVKFYGADGKTQITDASKLNGNNFKGTYADGLVKTGHITLTYTNGTEETIYGISTTPNYYKNTTIKTVVIGDGVVSICDNGFYECTALTSVVIPDSVTRVGTEAFSGCSGLTSITFGKNVTTVGSCAFFGCSNLESEFDLGAVTSIGDDAFRNCSKITAVTLGNDLTNIGKAAFSNCSSLTSVSIPKSVTAISENAFYTCSNLTTVIFENGSKLTSIGWSAFNNCPSLRSISLPETVNSISSEAFGCCTSLESVNIPSLVTVISNSMFYKCSKLTSVSIPDKVTTIGAYAFYNCAGLKSINIPVSVTSIDSTAFGGDSTVTIGESTLFTGITFKAYDGTTVLTVDAADLPGNTFTGNGDGILTQKVMTVDGIVYSLPGGSDVAAIGYTGDKTDITIPSTVTGDGKTYNVIAVGNNGFKGNTTLKTVSFTDSIKSIGQNAFSGCTGLKSVIIGNKITGIGASAFSNCTGIEKAVFGKGIESVGDGAFSGVTFYKVGGTETLAVSVDNLKGKMFELSDSKLSEVDLTSLTKDGIKYELSVENETATVIGYTGDGTVVGIPEKVTDDRINIEYTVTAIGASAFKNKTTLTSVTIPATVTSIGASAFEMCASLTAVIIPDKVTEIGNRAFYKCSKAATLTIGKEVTSIGEDAFNNCDALESVVIPDSVTSMGGSAFYYCDALKSVVIGNGLIAIGGSTFFSCEALEEVTIGENVKSIGTQAFRACGNLKKITIPDSVTEIGKYAFGYCEKATSVTFGKNVKTIGEGAFKECEGLSSLIISGSVESIGAEAFSGCSGLTTVFIPTSVTSITPDAFGSSIKFYDGSTQLTVSAESLKGCTFKGISSNLVKITSIKDENGIEYKISGTEAIAYKYEGTAGNLTVPSTVTDSDTGITYTVVGIGDNAFGYDGPRGNLKEVTLSDGIKTIGTGAFGGCTKLETVNIPDSVNDIKSDAFKDLTFKDSEGNNLEVSAANLKGKTFKGTDSVLSEHTPTVIKDGIRYTLSIASKTATVSGYEGSPTDVTILSKVTDSESGLECTVKYIGNEAFKGCTSLVSIVIPESVTEVGEYAFKGCTGLKNVTLGKGITDIPSNDPFDGCSGIKLTVLCDIKKGMFSKKDSITEVILGDGVIIGELAFSECKELKSVTFSNGITAIGEKAFFQCAKLETVIISDSVADIGSYAFYICKALKSVTFGNGLTTIGSDVFSVTFKDTEGSELEASVANLKDSTFTGSEGVLTKDDSSILTVDGIRYKLSTDGTATVIGYAGTATDVTIPATVSNGTATYNVIGIGEGVFKGCAGLTTIIIPDSVTSIGATAFTNCTGIEKAVFGKGIESVGVGAFDGVTFYKIGGTEILTVSAENLKGKQFELSDSKLTEVDLTIFTKDGIRYKLSTDGTATVIGYTGTAVNVSIPESVTDDRTGSAVTYIVKYIGNDAFKGCTDLTSVEIPNSVKDINASAFYGCTSLKSVRIGNHTATIGEKAFYGCPLTYLSIPASVTTIGADAFNSVKFYDSDGNEITVLDADHLKNSVFKGDNGSELKKSGSAEASADSGDSKHFPVILICIILILIAFAIMYRNKKQL